MARVKNLSAQCPHCASPVIFPATDAGLTVACPHCGHEIELLPVFDTAAESEASRKGLTWAIVGIVLMLLALGIAVGGLMYFRGAAEDSAAPETNQSSPAERP